MNLTELTIKETADLLAKGETTALEVTKAYLGRIEEKNPELNAYLTVFTDEAMEEAREGDERRAKKEPRSKYDGVPIALKDNISIRGRRTTAGSQILKNYKPNYDATVVRKLRSAGLVILGKTNLDEFAMGSSTENSAFGPSKNPHDTTRVPGGSSGGSAVAVAANLCAGALGSDTGGSIRLPASFCGIVGLKPTYGTVSRYGLLAMASSLDQIGPMTKSVEDAEILLDIIRGKDRFDSTTIDNLNSISRIARNDIKDVKIGIPKEYFGEGMSLEVEKIIRSTIQELKELGAETVEVSLPNSDLALAAYYIICPVEVASNMARYDGIRYGESLERESATHSIIDVYKKTRSKYLGEEVKRRIMLGTYTSSAGYYDAYYNKAMQVRALIKKEFEEVFQKVDCLATPVSPTVAFKIGEKSSDPLAMYLGDINTVPINPAGVPAISIPCGFVEKEGKQLPVGLQLIGPQGGEETLFAVAKAYEKVSKE